MLALLDRDGVINEDLPLGVTCLKEFRFLPGALEAIAALTAAGARVAIVTNQSGVAKGLLSETDLEAIHRHLCERVREAGGRIDAIYHCTDHPDRPGPRRKPAPGMIEEAMRDFAASPAQTLVIGDAERDLTAAAAAGCRAVLVKTGKGQLTLNKGLSDALQPVTVAEDLADAAAFAISFFQQGAKG